MLAAGTRGAAHGFAGIVQRRKGDPTARFGKGQWVEWNWGQGTGAGKVAEHFTERVTRTIAGKAFTRNADAANPACLIEQEDGDRVLKSESGLTRRG